MRLDNYDKVKNVLCVILFANFLVSIVKIIVGTSINSASMTADGFHSFSDGASNIVGIIGISIASKPSDKEHPYGHKKFEIMASMAIGVMLVIMSLKIITDAFFRFQNPTEILITNESLIALILTLLINIIVCTYEYKIGHKLHSHILISDSMHTRSDILVSVGVLISLIAVKIGLPPIIDPIASLIVSAAIIYSAYEIFKTSTEVLVDSAILDENMIKDIVQEFELVRGVHNIRSRGSEDDIHLDMHILVNPNINIEDAHNLVHSLEECIREKISKYIQVIIHIEPFYEKYKN